MESSFEFEDQVELTKADLTFLNECREEAVARGRKGPYSEFVSTGKGFWLFWESILPCRKTCVSIISLMKFQLNVSIKQVALMLRT
jgi:hypothetical protein